MTPLKALPCTREPRAPGKAMGHRPCQPALCAACLSSLWLDALGSRKTNPASGSSPSSAARSSSASVPACHRIVGAWLVASVDTAGSAASNGVGVFMACFHSGRTGSVAIQQGRASGVPPWLGEQEHRLPPCVYDVARRRLPAATRDAFNQWETPSCITSSTTRRRLPRRCSWPQAWPAHKAVTTLRHRCQAR